MELETIISNEYTKKVIPLIDNAKNSIDICVFDWRWYFTGAGTPAQDFNQAIVRAVRRGVRVRALVNSRQIVDTLQNIGVKVKHNVTKNLLHLKMIIIDDQIVVTGSHNYTQSAFCSNFELSVIIKGLDNKSKFSEFFKNLFGV